MLLKTVAATDAVQCKKLLLAPNKNHTTMSEEQPKVRYSDEELAEFKQIILEKLAKAQEEYDILCQTLSHSDGNDTLDTSPTFKVLEEWCKCAFT